MKAAVVITLIGLFVGLLGASGAGAFEARSAGSTATIRHGESARVAVDGLRLRSEPRKRGYVKGLLYRGDKVFVNEQFASSEPERDWYGVTLMTRSASGLPKFVRGYVHKSYLRR
ncbi:SH3 domain-containing protein [Streptomyces sp. NPDC051561]|uniref:SH3 domain-containing protein n=1 Tax=Streptomyces sp. NPDC051561 TaxID=3365658 RepID=UPI0037A1E3AC